MYIISAVCTAATFNILYYVNEQLAWLSLLFVAALWAAPVTRFWCLHPRSTAPFIPKPKPQPKPPEPPPLPPLPDYHSPDH